MYIPDADASRILEAVDFLAPGPNDGPVLLIGKEDPPDSDALIAGLGEREVEFLGGVFPGVISGAKRCVSGAVLKVLPLAAPPVLVEGLGSDPSAGLAKFSDIEPVPGLTAVILANGLTSDIDFFLRSGV